MIINMNGAKAPETPSSVLQEKTVTPETLPTVIGADEGYDGLTQVTVNPDAQLKAENIRSGKTIFGVQGAFVGEPVIEESQWQRIMTTNRPVESVVDKTTLGGTLIKDRSLRSLAVTDHIELSGIHLQSNALYQANGGQHTNSNGQWFYKGMTIVVDPSDDCDAFTDALADSYVYDIRMTQGMVKDGVSSFKYYGSELSIEDGVTTVGTIKGPIFYTRYSKTAVDNGEDVTIPSIIEGKLIFPASVTKIGGYYVMDYGVKDKLTLEFKGTTPPGFNYNNPSSTLWIYKPKTIIVPKGCGDAYRTADKWDTVANLIVEADE